MREIYVTYAYNVTEPVGRFMVSDDIFAMFLKGQSYIVSPVIVKDGFGTPANVIGLSLHPEPAVELIEVPVIPKIDKHQTVSVNYTIPACEVWLECSCGDKCNLGFLPTPEYVELIREWHRAVNT